MLRDLAIGLTHSPNPFHITIISLKPLPQTNADAPTIPEQLRTAGIHVHSLNLASALTAPRAILKLARLLHHLRPQIVYSLLIHANLLTTLALPLLALAPATPLPKFIQSIHTLQPNPAWHWTIQGIISQYADTIAAPSQPILDRITSFGNFQRGTVIPNGIDIARFANALPIPPEKLPWPPDSRVIGYVGRFDPVKNLPLLLRAFATILNGVSTDESPLSRKIDAGSQHPVHLALVGYGRDESRLRTLSTSLHIAPFVHFCGPTTAPQQWYKTFSVMCLPSTVEGFGLTLVEAMAAGIPIVALNTPVTGSILRDGIDVRLVPDNSPQALAVALQNVIEKASPPGINVEASHQEQIARLEASFSLEQMVARHKKLFNNLLYPTASPDYQG